MEELILSHLDIDTRRALGLPPRKLPPSEFVIPLKSLEKTFDNDKIIVTIDCVKGSVGWLFGIRYVTTILSSMTIMSGTMPHMDVGRHPDFNEDGSFNRRQRGIVSHGFDIYGRPY